MTSGQAFAVANVSADLLPTRLRAEVCSALGEFNGIASFRAFSAAQKRQFMLAELDRGERVLRERAGHYNMTLLAMPALSEISETRDLVRDGKIREAVEKSTAHRQTMGCP